MKATLALEDGRIFTGKSFGAIGETSGELVFNTGLSGYQEILTDPSYHGQIVTMTAPLIGNTGVNSEDEESGKIQAAGFIVREQSRITSNFRCEKSLDEYLKEQKIVGISNVDTRAITRHIRSEGAKRCVISTKTDNADELIKKAVSTPSLKGRDMVAEVTCGEKKEFTEGLWHLGSGFNGAKSENAKYHVAAIDLGIKRNILRHLCDLGCRVTLFPASTPASEIMAAKPDGLFLSNGPGDPGPVPQVRDTVVEILGRIPVFGICLGHQILCLALGAKTFKMKFGHRGINHPVMDIAEGRTVHITSQNHGFAVERDSLPDELELTHYSLNDDTVEGVRHKKFDAFSVQYHPEASPGPQDTTGHFAKFLSLIEKGKV